MEENSSFDNAEWYEPSNRKRLRRAIASRTFRPRKNLPCQTIKEALNKKFLTKPPTSNISLTNTLLRSTKSHVLTNRRVGISDRRPHDRANKRRITIHTPKKKFINLRAISSSNGMLSIITHNKSQCAFCGNLLTHCNPFLHATYKSLRLLLSKSQS